MERPDEYALPSEYLTYGWCQGALARQNDTPVLPGGLGATSWCVVGAIATSSMRGGIMQSQGAALIDSLRHIVAALPAEWNDKVGRTQREAVLAMEEAEASCGISRRFPKGEDKVASLHLSLR